MDELVTQALVKWPDVPHCYRWLALDARGVWRMRDAQMQLLGLVGDRISNSALLGFINRNYLSDERGAWYFQNGPQRVYVDLEAAPYIAHTDPLQGFVLHTGEPLSTIDGIWMTSDGRFVLKSLGKIATLDDRDLTACLDNLRINGHAIDDDQLLAWLSASTHDMLMFHHASREIPVQRIPDDDVEKHFGFVQTPLP